MSAQPWRYIGASVIGTSHLGTDVGCQDASRIELIESSDGPVLVLVGADGAGSAKHSAEGARLASSAIVEKVVEHAAAGGTVGTIDEATVALWYEYAAERIAIQAEATEQSAREFACTLLIAVVGHSAAVFGQLGDGAVVISDGDDYKPLFWPQSGEYANMTYFITAPEHLASLQIERRTEPVEEIALLTDGLQMLALRYETRTAHAPFFRPMFTHLRNEPSGEADRIREPLVEFLGSPRINERTDDDKTLLLATRRAPAPPAAVETFAVTSSEATSTDI